MLDLPMSIVWFRLRLRWCLVLRRRPCLPVSAHLRRDLNLPPSDATPHWRDLLS